MGSCLTHIFSESVYKYALFGPSRDTIEQVHTIMKAGRSGYTGQWTGRCQAVMFRQCSQLLYFQPLVAFRVFFLSRFSSYWILTLWVSH